MKTRVPLRVTLLSSILAMLVSTFTLIWISATRGLETSVYDMAETLTREALSRVQQEAELPLRDAGTASSLAGNAISRRESQTGRPLSMADAETLIFEFHAIMRAFPRLTFLSISLGPTGEYFHVERREKHFEAVKVLRPAGGNARRTQFVNTSYRIDGNRLLLLLRANPNYRYDARQRPYYLAAQRARRAVWTEPYLFVNQNGMQYPGLSLATPLPSGTARPHAVLTADFSCEAMSRYLRDVHVSKNGVAFVAALRANGQSVLVAHPKPAIMLEKANGQLDLTPSERLPDPVLRATLPRTLREAQKQKGPFVIVAEINGEEYFLGHQPLERGGLSAGLLVPARDFTGQLSRHQETISLAGVIAMGLGVAFSMLISIHISRPLQTAVTQLKRAGRFELDLAPMPPSVVAEVDAMGKGIEQMKVSLRSFSRYVPSDLVRRVLDSGTEPHVGGDTCELTIHFCDVAGFSSVAEKMDPDVLLKLLSEMLTELSAEIGRHGGTVDKYIGDNIMAFWGAPEPLEDHAAQAVRAALANQRNLVALRAAWRKRGLPELHARTGLHTGPAIVGNIGSPQRLNYTTLGDAVNVASRLEGLNKIYGTGILISQDTRRAAGPDLIARPVDWVGVAGRAAPLLVYEPLGFESELPAPGASQFRRAEELAEEAMEAYLRRDWELALRFFEELEVHLNGDTAVAVLAARCRSYQVTPPDSEWDGVHRTRKSEG